MLEHNALSVKNTELYYQYTSIKCSEYNKFWHIIMRLPQRVKRIYVQCLVLKLMTQEVECLCSRR